ncbi:alkaline phosphatase PhoX [Flavobacterium sp.]|uniref:alkaline phosphatase PhoX n=1 Tax=Flavobacterium sp. TaxID=239 RepID=UPI003A93C395
MKKSLLSLCLLFSLWSFAVINFNVGSISASAPASAPEAKATPAKKEVAAKKSTVVKAAAMLPPLTPANYPLSKDSEWAYFDLGTSLDETTWTETGYDVSAWATGQGPLGYGDATKTVISYGPDSGNKYITSYFVRDLNVTLAEVADMVEFGIRRDDGVIVYVNGVEVIRDNMPAGDVNYLTHSSGIVDGADEKRFQVFHLSKTIFNEGVNRIAVEMHNRDGQSSDLGFDMYIKDAPADFVCEEGHIGCFTSIDPTAQTPNLIIPTEHKFQLLFKQGDAYMDGSGNVPGNHDFTGYIPVEGSSEQGYLSVNHENNPGGVSIVDMHLDTDTNLWVIDNSQPVEFQNDDLVTTIRNCSGGVTPWGTIITAEENTSGGDANSDGYQDVGWLVEIDPVTASVMEYGNGKQEKLWAMGRMNHENVVVSADGTTAYYGEDGGTNCVYKFVADTPGDLTSGTVYVLSLDTALSSDEPTSSTATWIEVANETEEDRNNLTANAAAAGGTAFSGVEDCEISPIDGKVYFTAKGLDRVYRFTDNGETVSDFETFVGGMSYEIETANGVVTEQWGDGNDNLTFDDKGNLWVLQDGGLNYIWVIRPNHSQGAPQVLLHSSMPAGSEPTGLTFTPDFKYGFFSVQHPNGGNTPQVDATFGEVNLNASASVVIANRSQLGIQAPVADFSANQVTVEEGETVTFTDLSTNNPTSWMWTFEGGEPATSTDANPVVTYAEAGTYNVTLVSTNVAGDSEAELKQEYIIVEEALGIDTPNQLKDIVSLYPNPTKGQVTLELNDEAGNNVLVEVYDMLGRKVVVKETQSLGGTQKIDLNLTQLNGEQVLIINVKVGEKTGTYKMIKVN